LLTVSQGEEDVLRRRKLECNPAKSPLDRKNIFDYIQKGKNLALKPGRMKKLFDPYFNDDGIHAPGINALAEKLRRWRRL